MTYPLNFLILCLIAVRSYIAGRAHQTERDTRPVTPRRRPLPISVLLDRAERQRLEIPSVRRRDVS